MEKIRLLWLYLSNFKGIKELKIDNFNGGISIYGDNATGKTTIFDAFSWLMFGKDSLNSAAFEIKTLTPKGAALHGLEHCVEAALKTKAGDIKLKKIYSEKWTKRRGQAKKTFTRHTVDHFIDDVPCSQKEFKKVINKICTEDIFKLLTNLRHFNEVLHWTDRREILLKVCGDIPDADVIASNSNLAGLTDILGKHSRDEKKKLITAKQSEINEQLVKIPPRIDENQKSIVEVADDDSQIVEKLQIYKDRKAEKEKDLAALKAGGGVAEKEKKLAEFDAKIQVHKNEVSKKDYKRLGDQRKEISELDKTAIKAASKTEAMVIQQTDKLKRKKELAKQLKDSTKQRDDLRSKWFSRDKEQIQPLPKMDICPNCGGKISAEKIFETSRLALESFNTKKAEDLEAIQTEGKTIAEKVTGIELDVTAVDEMLKTMDTDIQALAEAQDLAERAIDERKAEHEKTNLTIPPDEILQELTTKYDKLKLDINALLAGTYEGVLAAEQELDRIDQIIEILNKDALQIKSNARIVKRVAELESEERTLSAEYEKLESELFLIESFVRSKVALLQPKIAQKFKHATFRLFVENINGGIEECCDTTLEGVPYASMNNGGRINAGLDICNTLSEYHGISLPCFIDNSEAVTELIDTDAQQIRLFVSKPDKELRIENN